MAPSPRRLPLLLLAGVALVVTSVAPALPFAAAEPGAPGSRAAELGPRPQVERYPVSFPSSRLRGGAGRVIVRRPLPQVLRVVRDFQRYPAFIRRIEAMKVVAEHDGQRDVEMTVPILEGRSRVTAVLRFGAPVQVGGAQVLHGEFVSGNVSRMEIVYRLEALGPDRTRLTFEMLVVPRWPLPGSLVTDEVVGAAAHVANNLRKESERLP
jgi:ribosome-associated toxin RatA of RatAB toxin-antitoxin module